MDITRLVGGAVVEIRTAVGTPDTWTAVTCRVVSASASFGARKNAGVLTQGEPGSLELELYDPDRELDPLNTDSPYAGLLVPGLWVRLSHDDGTKTLIGQGVVDSIEHELQAHTGRIRANDWASWMANQPFPGWLYGLDISAHATLQALAGAMFTHINGLAGANGFSGVVIPTTVHAETFALKIVPTGFGSGGANSGPTIWQHFTNSGESYLYTVYLSRANELRAVDALIPHGPVVELGLSGAPVLDLLARADAGDVINQISGKFSTSATVTFNRTNGYSILRWGQKAFAPARGIPSTARFGTTNAAVSVAYGDAVLNDRADPNPEGVPLEIWPTTGAELRALVAVTPMQQVHLDFPDHGIDLYGRAIGSVVRVTPAGWAVDLVTYAAGDAPI